MLVNIYYWCDAHIPCYSMASVSRFSEWGSRGPEEMENPSSDAICVGFQGHIYPKHKQPLEPTHVHEPLAFGNSVASTTPGSSCTTSQIGLLDASALNNLRASSRGDAKPSVWSTHSSVCHEDKSSMEIRC